MAKSRLNTDNGLWSALSKNQPVRYQTRKGFATLEEEINNNEVLKKAWNQALKQSPRKSKEMIAIYCYTLDNYFYKHLNESIRDWYDDTMAVQFPFGNYVSLLMSQVRNFDTYLILYRGVPFDTQLSASVGAVVYTNQFESCSSLKTEAEKFALNGTLYMFKTKSAIYVCEHSNFPHEKEYIIPPELKFTVTEVRPKRGGKKYFEVVLEMCNQQDDTSQRLISKLEKVSVSAEYKIDNEYGFDATEKLTVIKICEKATNSKEGCGIVAKQIFDDLEKLETHSNYWWQVYIDKDAKIYGNHTRCHRKLDITINGYRIGIYGVYGTSRAQNILEIARKNISKLEVTDSNVDDEQKEIIFKDVKYAIKYCDSFFDIAKNISTELKSHSKTSGKKWSAIVQPTFNNSYIRSTNHIHFKIDKVLQIRIYGSKE